MADPRLELLVEGFGFGEGPRWHGGRLWFSDFLQDSVLSVSSAGDLRVELVLDDRPSGLGWLPDGRLLVVAMRSRQVRRVEPDGRVVVHADLSAVAAFHCNDMVVAADGTAYVGNFGSDILGGEAPRPADLALVRPDGGVEVAAPGLAFPNGSVITPDGSTLVVGESFAHRYTAFPVGPGGRLGAGRTWAGLDGRSPDGCTLDADGAIWFADAGAHSVVRVAEGGEVLDLVEVPDTAYACALGGDDSRTLHVLTASGHPHEGAPAEGGRVWTVRVDAPHAGRP